MEECLAQHSEAMYRFLLMKYDIMYHSYTNGTKIGKFEVLLLGCLLVSIDEKEVSCTEGNELCVSDERVIGKTVGAYEITKLVFS